MGMVYLDNSATTKPHREVVEEVLDCMENFFGNPSSAHRLGIEAERKIKVARERVGKLIGAAPSEIVFTSGGSEANNTVIKGLVSPGDHIITSAIEHPSILKTMNSIEDNGCIVTYLKVDKRGIINLKELQDSVSDQTKLVSIMHVNNEIGSIEPVEDIVNIVKARNKKTRVHIDAVQSVGKQKLDVGKMGIDFMSFSSHKIHGPKGVGAIYIRKGIPLKSLITGGGQEMDIRSGTENLPGISGFGVAAEMSLCNIEENIKHVNKIKAYFIERLSEVDGVYINSPYDNHYIGNILSVSFENIRGEVLLHALEDYSIYVSTGSACSAKKSSNKNYVLPAIGLTECFIEGTIRFSFSYLNTFEEIDYTIEALKKILPFLRRIKK